MREAVSKSTCAPSTAAERIAFGARMSDCLSWRRRIGGKAGRDAAAAGQQAEGDLGQADLVAAVDRDAVVGGERDLEATAERGAVDGRDDRLREGLETAQGRLDDLHRLEDLRRVGLGRGDHALE